MANERPPHLRAVSGAEAAVTPDAAPSGTPGLTPPSHRGHIRAFTTDVIAELGYASREQIDEAVRDARAAGKAAEQLLLERNTITGEQLSRAVAERYGLDHIDLGDYKVDMAAANLISVSSARRYRTVPIG